jgi:steroid delta-isomerase
LPDAKQIRQLIERYPEMVTRGDVDGIVALYAEDARIEDPIGSDVLRGRDAVRRFYEASAGKVDMRRTGPVRVAGSEAAWPLRVLIGPEGEDQQALDIISVMAFDDAGRIESMRAFWSFDAMRKATPEDRA